MSRPMSVRDDLPTAHMHDAVGSREPKSSRPRSRCPAIPAFSGPRRPCWQKACWQISARRLHGYVGASARVATPGRYSYFLSGTFLVVAPDIVASSTRLTVRPPSNIYIYIYIYFRGTSLDRDILYFRGTSRPYDIYFRGTSRLGGLLPLV